MKKREPLAMIWAQARGRAIGYEGGMPWHFPVDLRRFKQTTMGHAIIMGRKTYETVGKPLPGRRNIIVTRNPALTYEGCEVAPSLEAAIALARKTDRQPFIIGGAQLYAEGMELATKLYVTALDVDVRADTFFPHWDQSQWKEVGRIKPEPKVTFLEYERVTP